MEIKVLGPGCSKCKTTYQVVEKVIKEIGCPVRCSEKQMLKSPIKLQN